MKNEDIITASAMRREAIIPLSLLSVSAGKSSLHWTERLDAGRIAELDGDGQCGIMTIMLANSPHARRLIRDTTYFTWVMLSFHMTTLSKAEPTCCCTSSAQ